MRTTIFWPSLVASLCAATLCTAPAHGDPVPRVTQDASGTLHWEQHAAWRPPPLPATFSLPPIESTDILDQEIVLTVDPATGDVSGTLTLTLRAEEALSSINMYYDGGLAISSAASSAGTIDVSTSSFQQLSYSSLIFSPTVPAGAELTVTVDYAGTLACDPIQGYAYCDIQPTMSVLLTGSAIPGIVDASGLGYYNVWATPRAIELRMPSGTDMTAPGALVLDDDDGTWRTTRWEMPGYHSAGAYLVMFGSFDAAAVPSATPPTTVYGASDAPQWMGEMVGWMDNIISFLDTQAGQSLPFSELSVTKLPPNWVFPGTAGHGMVLLAENYGDPGAHYFEETLAHETAHEWWGVVVSQTDYALSRWLSEGLATLSQIDYAADVQNPQIDRGAYLERRYREHRIALDYLASGPIPAVVPAVQTDAGANDTLWAYIRSSAALDTLRVLMGEDAFSQGLQQWASICGFEHCDSADFKGILETSSGIDLTTAFDAYVFQSAIPAPVMSFTQATPGIVTVTSEEHEQPFVAELIITLEDGTAERAIVEMSPDQPLDLAVGSSMSNEVRAVRPHPRHDAVLWSRSKTPGDMDFDGQVDGFDVIACARAVGSGAVPGAGGEGIFQLDLDFEPRCDRDHNGTIERIEAESLMKEGT